MLRCSRAVVSVVCATTTLAACARTGPPESLPPSAYAEDFDAAWAFIGDTYAYFDPQMADWE